MTAWTRDCFSLMCVCICGWGDLSSLSTSLLSSLSSRNRSLAGNWQEQLNESGCVKQHQPRLIFNLVVYLFISLLYPAFFLCQIPFFLTPHDLPCLLLPCTLICNILANIVSLLVLCTQNSTDPVDVLWFPQLDYNTIGYNCLLLPRRFNYWLRPLHVVVACRRRLWLDTIINVNLTEIERHEDIF